MELNEEFDTLSKRNIQINFNIVLGSGRYGTQVYLCKHRNEEYAIKKIRHNTNDNCRNISREKNIWQNLNHENIVKLLQQFDGDNDADGSAVIYQLMEFCESDLFRWFQKHQNRDLSLIEKMLSEIIAGLSYLHSEKIIHRDLKPKNILVTFRGVCKIADFDITVIHEITEENGHTINVGTRLYAAPEQFDTSKKGAYNLKVDLYSLGIIIMEFYTIFKCEDEKQEAIFNLKEREIIDDKFFEIFDRNKNSVYYSNLKDLIVQLIKIDPKDRPNITQVKEYFSFIKKISFTFMHQLFEKYPVFKKIDSKLIQYSKLIFIYKSQNKNLILLNNAIEKTVSEIGVDDKFDTITEKKMVEVLTNKQIIDIACGYGHVKFLTDTSEVFGLGGSINGESKNRSKSNNNVPVIIEDLIDKNIISISCGDNHTLALSGNGSVYAFGSNYWGELGIGSAEQKVLTPTLIQGLPEKLSKIIAISSGHAHNLALTEDGSVFAWGWNECGQLGDSSCINRKSVIPVVINNSIVIKKICCGHDYSLLLSNEGDVYSFGRNNFGQLGRQSDVHNERFPIKIDTCVKFCDIYANSLHSISIGLSESKKCFIWGKYGDECITKPSETNMKSINEALLYYLSPLITPKAIIF